MDAPRAVVQPNVAVFKKGRSYANTAIKITFKSKMNVFKDDLIDIN